MMALLKNFLKQFGLKLHSFDKGEMCTSQRQVIIKLIEKKDKDKSLIQN